MARTGFCFLVFGLMSLSLSLVIMPLIRLRVGDREERELRGQKAMHRVVAAHVRLMQRTRVLRVEISGAERLSEPGTLLVANHPTLIDALLFISLMPQVDLIVKESYYENPVMGGAAAGAGYIPNQNGPALVEECAARLGRGRSLLIFPEGTRSPANSLGPFARGAAHIALRAGCDLLPVTMRASPATLYRDLPWWDVPDRRFTLSLEVGEPIRIQDVVCEPMSRPRAARALTAALREFFEKRVPHA
jgi:1-acyl-sn-glycerol-3-phosphate acyltransferase